MSRILGADGADREAIRSRELHLRRAAERARVVGPLRRAVRDRQEGRT